MRRDRRGRRIGRNAWREFITDAWRSADHAWWLACENVCYGYGTEIAEYQAEHPRPTLKAFMVALAPGWTGQKGREYVAA
jgi:hypothetical protein